MRNKFKPIKSRNGWIYAEPLPTSEELKSFYAQKYYQNAGNAVSTYQASYSKLEIEHKHFEAKLCLNAIKENIGKNLNSASILELGSGEGFFLKELSRNVHSYLGVDFSIYGIEKFFPELLENFVQADIYTYIDQLNKQFDAIVLRNVIEHVPDPFDLLEALKSKVNSGGLIIFSFPNDYSLIQKLSKKMGYTKTDFWFCPPDHLQYFNTKTIKKLTESLGFSIIDMFAIFPVDLFLLHPQSNYIGKPNVGKSAHKARIEIELALWKQNPKNSLNLFRQFAQNGIGREVTVIVDMK